MGALVPSKYILQKSWKLGQKMGFKERRLRPDARGSHQYPSFSLFRTVHRHQLESLDAFGPWDLKLQALIEREASGLGLPLENPDQWDLFYRNIAIPIRSSFWYGWELVHNLESLYQQEMDQEEARRAQRPVLHVYRPPVSTEVAEILPVLKVARPPVPPVVVPTALPEGDEQTLWDGVAKKLFDEMDGDNEDAIWQTPMPDSPFARRTSAA